MTKSKPLSTSGIRPYHVHQYISIPGYNVPSQLVTYANVVKKYPIFRSARFRGKTKILSIMHYVEPRSYIVHCSGIEIWN